MKEQVVLNMKRGINRTVVNSDHLPNSHVVAEQKQPLTETLRPKTCNTDGIKCMYTNTDCLTNKLDELELFFQTEGIDIAAITETLPKNKPGDEILHFDSVPGYKCLDSQNGRGVCLYIKDSIHYTRCPEYENIFLPSVFCKVVLSKEKTFLIGVVYRSPNLTDEASKDLIKQLKYVNSMSKKSGDKFVLLGDFNLPDIDWSEGTCNKSIESIASLFLECTLDGMTQFVKYPTHHRTTQTPTLIDLILSNESNMVLNMKYFPPLGMSHHSVLTFNLDLLCPKPDLSPITKLQVDKGDYCSMRAFISAVDWDLLLLSGDDVDTWWSKIMSVVLKAIDMYVPKKTYKKHTFKRSFSAPNTLISRIRLKRRAFSHYKKFPTTSNYNMYVRYRNQVKWETRKNKKAREAKIAREAKSNPKAFFQYVSSKIKPKQPISNLLKDDGTLTEDDLGKAEELNRFFGSVFTREDVNNVPEFSHPKLPEINILSNVSICDNDIVNALKSLKVCKSPGPDGIHPRVLKELAVELALPLRRLFEKTLNDGKLPKMWKIAEVRPIFKKGKKSSPGNYRPVSLTSVVCKVFEGFFRDAMS